MGGVELEGETTLPDSKKKDPHTHTEDRERERPVH